MSCTVRTRCWQWRVVVENGCGGGGWWWRGRRGVLGCGTASSSSSAGTASLLDGVARSTAHEAAAIARGMRTRTGTAAETALDTGRAANTAVVGTRRDIIRALDERTGGAYTTTRRREQLCAPGRYIAARAVGRTPRNCADAFRVEEVRLAESAVQPRVLLLVVLTVCLVLFFFTVRGVCRSFRETGVGVSCEEPLLPEPGVSRHFAPLATDAAQRTQTRRRQMREHEREEGIW